MQLCVTCVQVIHCEPVLARPRKPRGNMVRTVSLAAQDVKPLSLLVKSAIIGGAPREDALKGQPSDLDSPATLLDSTQSSDRSQCEARIFRNQRHRNIGPQLAAIQFDLSWRKSPRILGICLLASHSCFSASRTTQHLQPRGSSTMTSGTE